MPCNIGYKSVSKTSIPAPQPLRFKKDVTAPEVDEELLDRLGVSDGAFLDWMDDLDTGPLLKEALKRALDKVTTAGKVRYSIKNGCLRADASYTGGSAKRVIERESAKVAERWTFELLGIVAQLLDYDIVLTEDASGGLTLEGEKRSDKAVHEYLRVTSRGKSADELRFEHFGSSEAVVDERDKFVALAGRLGVPLCLMATKLTGRAIPQDAVHRDFFRTKE